MAHLRTLFCLIFLCLSGSEVLAQTEPDPKDRDTSNIPTLQELDIEEEPIDSGRTHSVKKATLLALIPGAGQIYNRRYWKVPIVYAAMGTTIYLATENHRTYRLFLDAFFDETDGDSTTVYNGSLTPSQLIELQDIYRRYRDLNIIFTVVAYGLQILDAHVDAHLFHYDINDNLSMRWEPAVFNTAFSPSNAFGVKLSFQLE